MIFYDPAAITSTRTANISPCIFDHDTLYVSSFIHPCGCPAITMGYYTIVNNNPPPPFPRYFGPPRFAGIVLIHRHTRKKMTHAALVNRSSGKCFDAARYYATGYPCVYEDNCRNRIKKKWFMYWSFGMVCNENNCTGNYVWVYHLLFKYSKWLQIFFHIFPQFNYPVSKFRCLEINWSTFYLHWVRQVFDFLNFFEFFWIFFWIFSKKISKNLF